MKSIKLLSLGLILMLLATVSCYNREEVFPDFDYTASYFPFQFPVRTLVLGDYFFDNTNDNNLKFMISATMGGVYKNKVDRFIDFVIDESLTDDLYIGENRILPLPQSYYTLSHPSRILIPKGELHGGVEVQLTEAFLNDPNAVGPVGTIYVVPVRMTSATTDSIITGRSLIPNPDLRRSTDWVTNPMNFTLFGINYVNEYHGNYLMRGSSKVMNGNTEVETNIYRDKYVERDEVVLVATSARQSVAYSSRIPRRDSPSPGRFEMVISFDANGNGTIAQKEGSDFPVSGTAKFVKNSETWGGKPRHAIYLDYQVDDGTYMNYVKDTLVFRDKGVSFQEFNPVVVIED